MSITITIPVTGDGLRRLVGAVAEPCLVAAAALVGAGPLAQGLVAGTVRLARGIEIGMNDGDLRIAFS